MNAVDSSVIIAAFSSWHAQHDSAVMVLADQPHAPAHALAEAYSVLTRLPSPHRAAPGVVYEFLVSAFLDRVLDTGASILERIKEHSAASIAGGAVYDGLIGQAARDVDATLVTLDQRALATYHRLGARVRLIT